MERDEVSDLKARIQALEEKQGKARAKCYNCGKSGHFQRNCRAPRKRARFVSPPEYSKLANTQLPVKQVNIYRHEQDPIIEGPTISISVTQQKNSNLTACGYINGRRHVFTIDTGASQSIIRPDIVKKKIEPLCGVSLRTATGEFANVYGKIKVKLTIANISVNHVFIVADIVDEVIVGADFMISHNINLHMGRKVMIWRNIEIPLDYWTKGLQRNNSSTEHRESVKHGNADARSRKFCSLKSKDCTKPEEEECVIDVRLTHIDTSGEWSVAQRKDPILAKIISAKEKDKRPTRNQISAGSPLMKSYWALWNSLKVVNGCLYRIWESANGKSVTNLIVVPSSKINEVLREFHEGLSGGHFGIAKTLKKLKQRFYWVGCQQSVAVWIENCDQCIAAKSQARKSREPLQKYNLGAPFEQTNMTSNKMKARYDRAAESEGFNEGQRVLLYNPQRNKGLQNHWDGPYKVIKRINDVVYRIQKYKSPRSKMKVVHLERLAKYGKSEFVPIRDEQA